MSDAEKLIAAADRVEGLIEDTVDKLPWRVTETSNDPKREDTSWIFSSDGGDVAVSVFAYDPDYALIVAAANAMPGLVLALRNHAEEHSSYDCCWDPCAMVALADQILKEES